MRLATCPVEALLVYLACQDRPLGRDELAELLWPEHSQEQARVNLRVTLYRLRGQVEPYLLITRQHLALNPATVVDVDARQFERHLAVGELAAAVALYRGDFLSGFYLDGSPAFEQWALLERERLRTLAIATYQQLVDRAATAGQLEGASAYAQRLLQLDPWHEPTHRQLMRLLANAGQRSAALAQYETCRTLLAAELGVAPDEATTALYQKIQLGEVAVTQLLDNHSPEMPLTGFITPLSSLALVPHNIPLQPTSLIGRSAELAQIESLLANPDCHLLTLLGAGGIGKTRLAVAAAQRMLGAHTDAAQRAAPKKRAPHFRDGVCFVPLAPVEKPELVLATIAQSLELQTTGSDLQAELVAHLQERSVLLVLDNFEHLQEASGIVAQLLQQAPGTKLLVTSRERLHLHEEWLMPVAGLAQAEGMLSDAGQLFFRSARRVHPGFSSYGQEDAIAAICAQVEGMPLAIELAASWVRFMPCAEIAHQLAQNSHVFTTTLRNVPERHRDLRSLFDQSWRLLTSLEQNVLQRVSVFRGGWTLEKGAQVADATLPILVGLVDKSLVRTDGQGRFDLHELVRQYAAEQLVASGEVGLTRQRHLRTYLQLYRTVDARLRGPEAADGLARLEPEQDNLRAALQWALDEACYEDAAWLLLVAWWFWYLVGRWHELTRWFSQLLPRREVLNANVRLATLIAYWAVVRASEESQPMDRYMDEIWRLIEVCPEQILHSGFWYFVAVYSADLAEASAAWERSIACGRAAYDEPELGPEFGVASDRTYILCCHIWTYADRLIEHGEFVRAAPLLMESTRLSRAMGSRYETALILGISGRLALLLGDMAKAHALLHEAVTLGREFNHQELLGLVQPYLGLVTLYEGDVQEARRLLDDSLRLCLNLKDKSFVARVCTYLAETALWEGELNEAELWLARSLTYHANPLRIGIDQVQRIFVAASLATAQQRYGRAATLFGLADQVHSTVHNVITGQIRALADEALVTVQAALDPAIFAAAFETGRQLSLAEAFATILAPDHSVPTTLTTSFAK